VVDLMDEGFDLAVRVGRLPDSSTLVARRLATMSMAICAAPSYLAEHGTPRSIDDLQEHAGIVYGRAGQAKPWLIREGEGPVREAPIRSRLQLDDLQAIADAAVAGIGMAWLPCWLLAPHVRAGELDLVMDASSVLATEINAVWPRTRYLPAKTRSAIDLLVREIPVRVG